MGSAKFIFITVLQVLQLLSHFTDESIQAVGNCHSVNCWGQHCLFLTAVFPEHMSAYGTKKAFNKYVLLEDFHKCLVSIMINLAFFHTGAVDHYWLVFMILPNLKPLPSPQKHKIRNISVYCL
jgi:hypothetical protein